MLHMDRIGVRELRQNASKYLERVKAGESLEITQHGQPVAQMIPMQRLSPFERLVAEGKVQRATRDLLELGPPLPPEPGQRPTSEILDELREERFP